MTEYVLLISVDQFIWSIAERYKLPSSLSTYTLFYIKQIEDLTDGPIFFINLFNICVCFLFIQAA